MTPQDFVDRILAESGVLPQPRQVAYGERLSFFIAAGIDHVASPDTGEVWFHPRVLELFDQTRRNLGHPLPVNAGCRSVTHQLTLVNLGYKAATAISPHMLGVALDPDALPRDGKTEKEECLSIVAAVEAAAAQLGLSEVLRIGYAAYHHKFVHFDILPILFQPYADLPHPATWKEEFTDLRGRPWDESTQAKYKLTAKQFMALTWKGGHRW